MQNDPSGGKKHERNKNENQNVNSVHLWVLVSQVIMFFFFIFEIFYNKRKNIFKHLVSWNQKFEIPYTQNK